MGQRSVLLVGLDALRPEDVGEDLTPNIRRFQELGSSVPNFRSVFPSDTRANLASLMTGAYPSGHGIIANSFWDPALHPDVIDCGNAELLDNLMAHGAAPVVDAVTVGEILASRHMNMATIATGSAGSARLLNPHGCNLGHVSIACHSLTSSYPHWACEEFRRQAGGRLPERSVPDLDVIGVAVDTALALVSGHCRPALSVLWLNEPDTVYHHRGLNAATTRDTLRCLDRQFGRILEWWLSEGRYDGVQLILLSDHGQVGVAGTFDFAEALRREGFSITRSPRDPAGCLFLGSTVGQLYLREEPRKIDTLCRALRQMPATGTIFVKESVLAGWPLPDGTFPQSATFIDHARSPDIIFTYAWQAAGDRGRDAGLVIDVANGDGLLATHGGLTHGEMSAFAVFGGDCFHQNFWSAQYASMVDIAPTIMKCLDVPYPFEVPGRVLAELLRLSPPGGSEEGTYPDTPQKHPVRATTTDAVIQRIRNQGSLYVDFAL